MSCCVFTRGEFYIRDAVEQCGGGIMDVLCSGGAFKKIGNISSGVITIDGDVIGTENEFNPAMPESRMEIRSVSLGLSMSCSSIENLRLAFLSEARARDAGHRVDGYSVCYDLEDSDFFPFTFNGASDVSVFLKKDSGEKYLIEDQDYIVMASGVQITSSIPREDYTEIRIAYDYSEISDDVEFFSEAKKYKEVFFKGTNFADESGSKLLDARFYRVLFSPINETDLITKEDVLTLNVSGSVERVDGKWFKISKE